MQQHTAPSFINAAPPGRIGSRVGRQAFVHWLTAALVLPTPVTVGLIDGQRPCLKSQSLYHILDFTLRCERHSSQQQPTPRTLIYTLHIPPTIARTELPGYSNHIYFYRHSVLIPVQTRCSNAEGFATPGSQIIKNLYTL